ncbi:MAG TPA: nucleotide exchange factor GrpE [Mycobacteriales bacterium]|nr:nucleotide exchange factor GrpE [Mycobacteriales bacterium]
MTEPRHDRDEPPEVATRIRDKRRIDPLTGAVRPVVDPDPPGFTPPAASAEASPAASPAVSPAVSPAHLESLQRSLDERTADLQRLKAEYDNYRRRVERDRAAVAEQALASVLLGLLPVLDDIGRARAHGEVEGGFKPVADGLEATLTKLGLVSYAVAGDPFDPAVHEALLHAYSPDVTEPTCTQIIQPGYRLGERVLRPARVAVAEPPLPAESDAATLDGPEAAADTED